MVVSTFVEHPNNDQAILVTSCQFFILLIPSDHLNRACKWQIVFISFILFFLLAYYTFYFIKQETHQV